MRFFSLMFSTRIKCKRVPKADEVVPSLHNRCSPWEALLLNAGARGGEKVALAAQWERAPSRSGPFPLKGQRGTNHSALCHMVALGDQVFARIWLMTLGVGPPGRSGIRGASESTNLGGRSHAGWEFRVPFCLPWPPSHPPNRPTQHLPPLLFFNATSFWYKSNCP